jgi:hypothetical protein
MSGHPVAKGAREWGVHERVPCYKKTLRTKKKATPQLTASFPAHVVRL